MDIIGRSCMFITSESYRVKLKIHSQPFASPQHHHWQQLLPIDATCSMRPPYEVGFPFLTFWPLRVTRYSQYLPESNIRVTRIKEMITNLLNSWFFKQILLVSTLRNMWRTIILMLGCGGLWGQVPFKTEFLPSTLISPPA